MPVYCNPPALGRDSAYIIITCPLSSIYVRSLMSATGHTLSEFTPGYLWPIWSTPHGLLSGQSTCQDPTFTVGPVVLPGIHAQWHPIRDTGPNQEVHHWQGLHHVVLCMSGTWSGHPSITIHMRNLWKAVAHLQG